MTKTWIIEPSAFQGVFIAPWYGPIIGGHFGCALYVINTIGMDGV